MGAWSPLEVHFGRETMQLVGLPAWDFVWPAPFLRHQPIEAASGSMSCGQSGDRVLQELQAEQRSRRVCLEQRLSHGGVARSNLWQRMWKMSVDQEAPSQGLRRHRLRLLG